MGVGEYGHLGGNKGEVKSLEREKEIGDGQDWLAREREREGERGL